MQAGDAEPTQFCSFLTAGLCVSLNTQMVKQIRIYKRS